MNVRTFAALGWCILLSFGCLGESEKDVAERLDDKGAREVLDDASEDHYIPPADGKLNRDQIEMYLRVREREKEIVNVARDRISKSARKFKEEEKTFSGLVEGIKSLGSAADFLTADVRAAQELGYNTAEYEWVKSRILEAASSVMRERLARSSRAALDRRADELRRKMEETDNETERNTYAGLLETYERATSEENEIDEAVAYNRDLLEEYESALDTLGFELSKWETREGQAAERMEKFDRDLKEIEEGKEDPDDE